MDLQNIPRCPRNYAEGETVFRASKSEGNLKVNMAGSVYSKTVPTVVVPGKVTSSFEYMGFNGEMILQNATSMLQSVKDNLNHAYGGMNVKLNFQSNRVYVKAARGGPGTSCDSRTLKKWEFIPLSQLKNHDVFINSERLVELKISCMTEQLIVDTRESRNKVAENSNRKDIDTLHKKVDGLEKEIGKKTGKGKGKGKKKANWIRKKARPGNMKGKNRKQADLNSHNDSAVAAKDKFVVDTVNNFMHMMEARLNDHT